MMIIYFCLVFFINLAIENLTLIRLKHIRLSVESITEWFHLSKNLMYDISKENMFLIFVEESGLILPLFLFFFLLNVCLEEFEKILQNRFLHLVFFFFFQPIPIIFPVLTTCMFLFSFSPLFAVFFLNVPILHFFLYNYFCIISLTVLAFFGLPSQLQPLLYFSFQYIFILSFISSFFSSLLHFSHRPLSHYLFPFPLPALFITCPWLLTLLCCQPCYIVLTGVAIPSSLP